jgi:membrane-associated phospholipid phosphatase
MRMGKGLRSAAALAVVIVLAGPCPAGAQTSGDGRPEDRAAPLTLAGAGREFLRDAGRIWSAPARIKTRDIAPLLAIAATTVFLISADERIRDSVRDYAGRHPWVGDVSPAISQMGYLGSWATAGTFFGLGLVLKDERARDTGFLAASAMAQAFIVDNVVKGLAGRQRPYFADGVDQWAGPAAFFKRFDPDAKGRYGSFCSGHAANAFALATVVALQYRHRAWVSVLAYGVATAVGLSRMTLDKHWSSDVFCGAILGHAIARLVVRNHERRGRLVPMLACSRGGVALSVVYDLGPAGL